jgi:predicted tellurium resistance membrane protein TerC
MACRSLPERQRRLGILLGAGTAVALRIAFALVVSTICRTAIQNEALV